MSRQDMTMPAMELLKKIYYHTDNAIIFTKNQKLILLKMRSSFLSKAQSYITSGNA